MLQGKTADGPASSAALPRTTKNVRLRLISPTRCMAYALHAGRKTVIPLVHRKCRISLCKHFNCRCQSDRAYSTGHLHFFDAAPFVVLMRHVRFKLTLLSFIWPNNNNLCLICHTRLRSQQVKCRSLTVSPAGTGLHLQIRADCRCAILFHRGIAHQSTYSLNQQPQRAQREQARAQLWSECPIVGRRPHQWSSSKQVLSSHCAG